MAQSDVTVLKESSWCQIEGLTPDQALALEELGRELSAKESPTGESEDEETTSLIQCRRTAAGQWEVRVREAVGIIGVGPTSWAVEPKIPVQHLFYLLERTDVLPADSGRTADMASGSSLLNIIFGWLLRSTEALLRSDLAKGYIRETKELAFVRGSVDPLALSRGLMRGRTQVRCTYEDFSVDIPINRVLKTALARGLASASLDPEAARRARRLLARFSGVGFASGSDLRSVRIERTTARYRYSLPLALHILRGDLREISVGSTIARCFLWRTPTAVEAAVRQILADGLSPMRVVKDTRSFPPLRFSPDLQFGPTAVGDVKYAIDGGKWRRSDVYQLLAFSVSHGCKRCVLINFSLGPPVGLSADVAGTMLSRISWRFDQTPQKAEDDLVGQVRDLLDGEKFP